MNIQEAYDRIASLPEFSEFTTVKPMAIAAAFRTLTDTDRTNTGDDIDLCYDLALALTVWGFAGTQAEALTYVSTNDAPPETETVADPTDAV